MTNQHIAKINDVAQEMDEMSDDVPALADLAQRLTEAVVALEQQTNALEARAMQESRGERMPRYLREIQHLVENEIRATRGYRDPNFDYLRSGIKPPPALREEMFRISGV